MSVPQLNLEGNVFELGGVVSGAITVANLAGQNDSKERDVKVALILETEGRGDTDSEVHSERTFTTNNGSLYGRFDLQVPTDRPISYDGDLLRITWRVAANVDIKWKRDPKSELDIVVVPKNGKAYYQYPHPLRLPTPPRSGGYSSPPPTPFDPPPPTTGYDGQGFPGST